MELAINDFALQHTMIPVPKIFDSYSEEGKHYLVMEYMEGKLLKYAWESMSEEDQVVIVNELKGYISQMRQLLPPEGVLIGTINGGPATDRRQFGPASGGPFDSERDFNRWQLAQLYPEVALSQREMYAALHKDDHRIKFSHGDLGFHNVIVKDGHVSAIIDWEFSGWYPEYWDYCKTMSFLASTDEGYLNCKELYEKQYHAEWFLYMWFGREIQHGGF